MEIARFQEESIEFLVCRRAKNSPSTRARGRGLGEGAPPMVPGDCYSVKPAATASARNILTVSSEYSSSFLPTSDSFFSTSGVTVMM